MCVSTCRQSLLFRELSVWCYTTAQQICRIVRETSQSEKCFYNYIPGRKVQKIGWDYYFSFNNDKLKYQSQPISYTFSPVAVKKQAVLCRTEKSPKESDKSTPRQQNIKRQFSKEQTLPSSRYTHGVTAILKYGSLKPLDPFGTDNKKFTDLQITYRVYRRQW